MNELSKLNEIETDVKIDMNDIVSIFTSKYEERLYDSKARLTAEIAEGRKVVAKLTKEATDSVDVSKFLVPHPLFNIEEDGRTLNESAGTVTVVFRTNTEQGFGGSYNSVARRDLKLTKKVVNEISKAKEKLNTLADELNTTMVAIRDMGRKERQVRARIIEQKLENSGMEHLLNDEGLQKLIELG